MYLNHSDSTDYFPSTDGTEFTVKLDHRVNLQLDQGIWKCGLVQACIAWPSKVDQQVYIGCNLVDDSLTGTGRYPILRSYYCMKSTHVSNVFPLPLNNTAYCNTGHNCMQCNKYDEIQRTITPSNEPVLNTSLQSNTKQVEFLNTLYVPLKVNSFEYVSIFLRDQKWADNIKTVHLYNCILHFKKFK